MGAFVEFLRHMDLRCSQAGTRLLAVLALRRGDIRVAGEGIGDDSVLDAIGRVALVQNCLVEDG